MNILAHVLAALIIAQAFVYLAVPLLTGAAVDANAVAGTAVGAALCAALLWLQPSR